LVTDSDFAPEALTERSGEVTHTLLPVILILTLGRYSISVIQWLLNAETSHPSSSPPRRLTRFFTTLFSALRNPSRAVLQFYPSSDDQIQLITSIAQKAGFGGGIVVDYPNSKKAKKVFLCLIVGSGNKQQALPKGLDGDVDVDDGKVKFERRRERQRSRDSGRRKNVKDTKDWILKKKEVRMAVDDALSTSFYSCLVF
jgi:18S rRNA (guanine1575-N7)-methyltransferase